MKPITDRIVDRAAEILVERILEANSPPNAVTTPQPRTDPDGDLICPECGRPFVTKQALGVHRARAHGFRGATK